MRIFSMFKTSNDRKIYTWELPKKENFHGADDWIDGNKFITVLDRHGEVSMIVFPDYLVHNDIYQKKFGGKGILSAGFVRCGGITHGRSTSIAGSPEANSDDSDALVEYVDYLNNLKKER